MDESMSAPISYTFIQMRILETRKHLSSKRKAITK